MKARLLMEKKFKIYNHKLLLNDGQIITRCFIVLVNEDGTYQFTDFHKYISSQNKIKSIASSDSNRFNAVCKLLNYCFFDAKIENLDSLTVDIVGEYLNLYGMCSLPSDDEYTTRKKNTVERTVSYVMDFLSSFIAARKGHCKIKTSDLFKEINVRNRYGKVIKKKVPVFEVRYIDTHKEIFRDIPNKAFYIIYNYIANYHTELLGLITLSAFAGLRPSEACNVRREDSVLGSGLVIHKRNEKISNITIDLTRELDLRSDHMPVGKIKKERHAKVPEMFLPSFIEGYETYMKYMDGKKYDANYGALNVNSRGNAITYASYYQKFHQIIKEEIVPILLNEKDDEMIIYGRLLEEHNISPHIFRHWYTVQLVLNGVENPTVLANYRGDKSEESALTYLKNKGELEKKYKKVNNEIFDYMQWAGEKIAGYKGIDKETN